MEDVEESVWNGAALIVPDIVYEKDSELVGQYNDYCIASDMPNVFQESDDVSSSRSSQDESNCDDKDEDSECGSDSGKSGSKGLSRRTIYRPPFSNKSDLYHPFHERDMGMLHFTSSPQLQSMQMLAMMSDRLRQPGNLAGRIRNETLALIHSNRKKHQGVRQALKSMITLEARITGLKERYPTRLIKVLGSTPLSALHDRVLCPVFGWTRGYHDYRFAIPPSGYQNGVPKIALLDLIIVGRDSNSGGMMSFMTSRNSHGILRTDDSLSVLSDSKVCVADFLQGNGQELWHVLVSPGAGWKTSLVVKDVLLFNDKVETCKPSILAGTHPNVPENLVLSFDFSNEYVDDDFDCSGPHAFALGVEMLRLASTDADLAWLSRNLFAQVPSLSETDFDLDRPFDIEHTRRSLARSQRGDASFKLEDSSEWMNFLFGGGRVVGAHPRELFAGACNNCGNTAERLKKKLLICSRCKNVNYCCKDCQVQDWKKHKKLCAPKKNSS